MDSDSVFRVRCLPQSFVDFINGERDGLLWTSDERLMIILAMCGHFLPRLENIDGQDEDVRDALEGLMARVIMICSGSPDHLNDAPDDLREMLNGIVFTADEALDALFG